MVRRGVTERPILLDSYVDAGGYTPDLSVDELFALVPGNTSTRVSCESTPSMTSGKIRSSTDYPASHDTI